MYYTYMLRCEDGSLYSGITTDPDRRLKEHLSGGKAGAKYTKSRKAVKIEACWVSGNRSTASKLEYALKHLSKSDKEILAADPEKLSSVLKDKLDCNLYKSVV